MSELSPRSDTTYGAEAELSIPILDRWIVARLRGHYYRRVVNGIQDIAKGAGITEEAVMSRLEAGDGAYADLLEQTLRNIERKASADHREAMARVAAQAWSGDDAVVDRAALVVDTIGDLHPVHVRVLVATARLNEQAGDWHALPMGRPNPVTLDGMAKGSAIEVGTADGIVGQLIARGLVTVNSVASFHGQLRPDHFLTQLGEDVLDALLARGS